MQLPYYRLGVAAFLVHVGVYARLAALGWFAESSVRRRSYAAAVVGAMVVGTVGLALCGMTFFNRGLIWTIDAHSWRWWRRSFLQV